MVKTKSWMAMTLTLLLVGTMACGEDETDHETARQAISSNAKTVSTNVVGSISFLDQSALISRALGSATGGGCAGESSGADFDTGTCESDSLEIDEAAMEQSVDELTRVLEARVFTRANVESESGQSVTYRLKGRVVCAEGNEVDRECADLVDRAQVRLVVTAPDEDVRMDIHIGPDRAHPLTLELRPDLVAVTIHLEGIKGAVEHLAFLEGETPELPDRMSGSIRLALQADSSQRASLTLSVLKAIDVANDDWRFALGASEPTLEVVADAGARTLEATSDIGSFDARFPFTDDRYDSQTGDLIETTHRVDLSLGGSSASALLSVDDDKFTVTNIGLGDKTSTLSIDGSQVLAIDLNANDGRRFDATVSALSDDQFEVQLSPIFDLVVDLDFIDAPDTFEVDDWMLDEVLHIVAQGASGATLRLGSDDVEVVEGQLSISLDNAGITHDVATGQCLIAPDRDSADVNPFDELSVEACR